MSPWQQYVSKLLTVYYNVKVGAYLLWSILSYGPDAVLTVKARNVKPDVLSKGITDHTVKINVSDTKGYLRKLD